MVKLYNLTEKTSYKLKTKMKTINKEIIFASLRRLIRNFVGAFFVTFTMSINFAKSKDIIINAFLIDIKTGFGTIWAVMLYPAILASLIAGFTAIGKLFRDILRENGLDKWANKIFF